MSRKLLPALLGGVLGVGLWANAAGSLHAQPAMAPQGFAPAPALAGIPPAAPVPEPYHALNRFWYYPYYYFPANYWPAESPRWPEATASGYHRYPAYMAYPPFKEPHWRYEYWQPQTYYRGFHFWLDQF